MCRGQSEIPSFRALGAAPASGTHRWFVPVGCLLWEKVRTDPKRAFFFCNGSNQMLIKLVRAAGFCFTMGNVPCSYRKAAKLLP